MAFRPHPVRKYCARRKAHEVGPTPRVVAGRNLCAACIEADAPKSEKPEFCPGCGHSRGYSCWSGCPIGGDLAVAMSYFK